MFYSPGLTQSSSKSPSKSPSKGEESALRLQIFQEAKEIFRAHLARGEWPDFSSGDLNNPRIHYWYVIFISCFSSLIVAFIYFRPTGEDGKKIPPLQLSEAFAVYHIPMPSCLCPTQETDPEQRQNYKMHIRICSTPGPNYGKVIMSCFRQREGCGAWG